MPIDEYTEKPRPNLYNVVKKLREQKGKMLHRICYVSKFDEAIFKGDYEKQFSEWSNQVFNTQDDSEIPLQEGETLDYDGLAVVLGPYVVHLLEAEQTLMNRYLKKLQQMKSAKQSIYSGIWVLHYTEDVPVRAYSNWYCKNINTSQATREIRSFNEFDRVSTIYTAMLQIGEEAKKVQQKGEQAVVATIKSQAAELIPCGEELASVVGNAVYSIKEWMEFIMVTPDICLEKEMQWPVD